MYTCYERWCESAYDCQKLRIQTGNRLVANFKVKLGQEPGKLEETMDKKGKEILDKLRAAFKKIADGVTTFPRAAKFSGSDIISSYTELCLVAHYLDLEKTESTHFRRMGGILKDIPIYSEFLKGVLGVGNAMAGVIISEIDISKARHASSIWKYAGLDVVNGKARHKERGVKAEWNHFLKTKLLGVLGPSFLRSKKKKGDPITGYGAIYYDHKTRMENHMKYGVHNDEVEMEVTDAQRAKYKKDGKPVPKVTSKGRRHNMAIRYMVKMFLVDLYQAWRTLEGLPVTAPYSQAILARPAHGKELASHAE